MATRGVAPKQHRVPRVNPSYHPYAREGQAVVCPLLRGRSPTRSVAPKQHRVALTFSVTLSARASFSLILSAGAMLLDRLGPPGRCSGCWPHDGEVAGGAVADLGLLISGPRVTLFSHPLREGADGQAVVCPLLRGRSPTRGVAPKQHRGLRRAFSPAFRAGSLYPLARGCRRSWRGEIWFRRRDAARPARAAWIWI